jgi:N-carbamoylputrescine amidase
MFPELGSNGITRVAFVQWPEGLAPGSDLWAALAEQVVASAPDVLITNELPFGTWLASSGVFDHTAAGHSVALHESGLDALRALGLPLVLSSRPVWAGRHLANEAFALRGESYQALHHKHFFPAEEGWHETTWFRTARPGFEVADLSGLRVGVLLCTELMFNEHARAYGRAGADLILAPRATGGEASTWKTAAAMAAIVSGAYVVSSNRIGSSPGSPVFDGGAFAFAPDGALLAQSSPADSLVLFDLDRAASRRQKAEYPNYVQESLLPLDQ